MAEVKNSGHLFEAQTANFKQSRHVLRQVS